MRRYNMDNVISFYFGVSIALVISYIPCLDGFICFSIGAAMALATIYLLHMKVRINLCEVCIGAATALAAPYIQFPSEFIFFSFGVAMTLAATYLLHTEARINLGEELEHAMTCQISAETKEATERIHSALVDIATTLKNDGVKSAWEKLCLYARNQASETRTNQGGVTNAPASAQKQEEPKRQSVLSKLYLYAKNRANETKRDQSGATEAPAFARNQEEPKPDEMKSEDDARKPESVVIDETQNMKADQGYDETDVKSKAEAQPVTSAC